MASSKLVLGYWNIRGFAHPIRYALEYAGVDYEEVIYKDDGEGGPGRKEWFEISKFNLGLDFPNVPYMKDGDLKLTEKSAILKYICRKFKPELLPPPTDLAGWAHCEMIESMITEVWDSVVMYAYVHSDEVKAGYSDMVVPKLKQLSKYIGNKKHVLGDQLRYVDFMVYEVLYQLKTGTPAVLAGLDNLTTFMKNFQDLPQMRAYMSSPKFINGPCFSSKAKFRF